MVKIAESSLQPIQNKSVCCPMAKTSRCHFQMIQQWVITRFWRGNPGSIPGNRTSTSKFLVFIAQLGERPTEVTSKQCNFWSEGSGVRSTLKTPLIFIGQVTKWLRCCIKAAVGKPARVQIASCSNFFITRGIWGLDNPVSMECMVLYIDMMCGDWFNGISSRTVIGKGTKRKV